VCLAGSAAAQDWPPTESGSGAAKSAVTADWAKELRGLVTFAQLRQALGAAGHLEAVEDNGYDEPRARYRWTGAGGRGSVVAYQYRSGSFAALVSPADLKGTIEVNGFGAFICRACRPAVDVCGSRPSWVSRQIHWDTFDCPRTVMGPQTSTN
jgi:hypothetical protein